MYLELLLYVLCYQNHILSTITRGLTKEEYLIIILGYFSYFFIHLISEGITSSLYLDLYLYIDINLSARLHDKLDDIVNFPFLRSNNPSAPAYGVHVSKLIRYAKTCSEYQDFIKRGRLLTTKLSTHGYQITKLASTLDTFYGVLCFIIHDIVNPYNVAVSRFMADVFARAKPYRDFLNPGYYYSRIFLNLCVCFQIYVWCICHSQATRNLCHWCSHSHTETFSSPDITIPVFSEISVSVSRFMSGVFATAKPHRDFLKPVFSYISVTVSRFMCGEFAAAKP